MAQDMVRKRIRKKERERENKEYIKNLKDVPCKDCGNRYPIYVMDFHHISPRDESLTIGKSLVNEMKGWGRKRIDEEIDKCVVLCSNCHRIRHYEQEVL